MFTVRIMNAKEQNVIACKCWIIVSFTQVRLFNILNCSTCSLGKYLSTFTLSAYILFCHFFSIATSHITSAKLPLAVLTVSYLHAKISRLLLFRSLYSNYGPYILYTQESHPSWSLHFNKLNIPFSACQKPCALKTSASYFTDQSIVLKWILQSSWGINRCPFCSKRTF